MPARPPTDLHLVCADHPEWVHDGTATWLWDHLVNEHSTASPNFTAVSASFPVE